VAASKSPANSLLFILMLLHLFILMVLHLSTDVRLGREHDFFGACPEADSRLRFSGLKPQINRRKWASLQPISAPGSPLLRANAVRYEPATFGFG
jgi:hypothetical protein